MIFLKIKNKKTGELGICNKRNWDRLNTLFVSKQDSKQYYEKKEDWEIIEESQEITPERKEHGLEIEKSIKVRNKINGNIGYVSEIDWALTSDEIVFREKADEFKKTDEERKITLGDNRHAYIVKRASLEAINGSTDSVQQK